MYLSSLQIKNFRGITDIKISLDDEVTILLGENNGGKTSIIDALRLVLSAQSGADALRVSVDDFHDRNTEEDIEIEATFENLTQEETVSMHEALYAIKNNDDCILNARLTYNGHLYENSRKVRGKITGGPKDSGIIPNDAIDYIDVTYLKPLRDPASGLKPSRYSCVSKHAKQSIPSEQQRGIEDKLNENRGIAIENFAELEKMYNLTMQDMIGEILAQKIKLDFLPASFDDLIASLRTLVDEHEWELNGLGYNNIVYMSLVMAQHANNDKNYNVILIEEPEAHIHPMILRSYLKYIRKLCSSRNCQVIISTHSPILASKAPLESIRHISMDGTGNRVARSLAITSDEKKDMHSLDKITKRKLERYLDATRAEIFFCKKAILVEGVAEQLILPAIADRLGCNLDRNNITIINCEGLNFDAFIPILYTLQIKSVILTDTDRYTQDDESKYLESLSDELKDYDNIQISKTHKTFEYALLEKNKLRDLAKITAAQIYPHVFSNFNSKECERIKTDNFPSDTGKLQMLSDLNLYHELFESRRTKKGVFAQMLLLNMDENYPLSSKENALKEDDFPDNIVKSIQWLCCGE